MPRAGLLIGMFVWVPVAAAHHGFGTFDVSREVEITGTVTDLAFVNPHSWLYLDVESADGDVGPYRCELRSATTLRRSGWSPDMFPAGSRVTITGAPDRNDPQACYVSTVIFADGSSIDRYGQRTPPVRAEPGQRPARLPSGAPNLAGEWAAEQLVMTDPRGQRGSLVPLSDAAEPAPAPGGRGADEGRGLFASGEVVERLFLNGVELTDAGRRAAESFDRFDHPAMRCEPVSVVVDWSHDAPVNRITQDEDAIVLEYGKYDYARTIHMSAGHPAEIEPSLTGHSIGRWEGDVLVVDTVGFAAGALTRTLWHSGALHLVERFSLDPETMTLTRTIVAEDPAYFAEPWTGTDLVYPSNVPYAPSPCDDRSLFERSE